MSIECDQNTIGAQAGVAKCLIDAPERQAQITTRAGFVGFGPEQPGQPLAPVAGARVQHKIRQQRLRRARRDSNRLAIPAHVELTNQSSSNQRSPRVYLASASRSMLTPRPGAVGIASMPSASSCQRSATIASMKGEPV